MSAFNVVDPVDVAFQYYTPEEQPYLSGFDPEETEDVVNKPSHYTRFAIEPVSFIMRNDLPFHTGNIVKYALRAGYKLYPNQDEVESEITDLKKVIRYAEMRINLLNGEVEL